MQNSREERERGVTINRRIAKFTTKSKFWTLIDLPGHKCFANNTYRGAAQADVGVLMIPADGNFCTTIARGNHKAGEVQGGTRAHALALSVLGVKQLIVIVNKMDSDMARYKEDRFLEIRNEIFSTLISVGWPRKFVEESVPVIPISAWEGKNIIEPAEEMPWWSGTSVIHPKTREHVHMTTFLDYLQDFVYVPDPPKIEATIATVTEGFRIKGVGYVVTAHVDAGTFRPSEKVKILPKRNAPEFTGTIQSIETHRLPISEAKFGYFCGFHIPEIQAGNLPRLGDVMCLNSDKNICRVKSFKVQIRVVSHPGELKIGYEPVAVVKTMLFAAKMTTILWKIGRKCPEKLESPLFVKQGEIAECIFVVQRPVVLLPFKELEGFGRVLFLEGGNISLIGKIVEVFE